MLKFLGGRSSNSAGGFRGFPGLLTLSRYPTISTRTFSAYNARPAKATTHAPSSISPPASTSMNEKILLIDLHGKNMGEMTLRDATLLNKRENSEGQLISVSPSSDKKLGIYRMFPATLKDPALQDDKKKSSEKSRKEYRLNSSISQNDLTTKIHQMSQNLLKGHQVYITLHQVKPKFSLFEPMYDDALLKRVREELAGICAKVGKEKPVNVKKEKGAAPPVGKVSSDIRRENDGSISLIISPLSKHQQ